MNQPRKINTLSYDLEQKIKRYTLPEVLAHLASLVYAQAHGDRSSEKQWLLIVGHLEEAVEASLDLTNNKLERGEDFWQS